MSDEREFKAQEVTVTFGGEEAGSFTFSFTFHEDVWCRCASELSKRDTPQPDPDVMGYLHSRYGVEPAYQEPAPASMPERYVVDVGAVLFTFRRMLYGEGSWVVECNGESAASGYTLAEACDAADKAARKMLSDTMDKLTPCPDCGGAEGGCGCE